jgi:hypothetical protein
MVKTTFAWVSFSEENQKLLTYQMFPGFLQALNMVNLVSTNAALLLVFLIILCCHVALLAFLE